MAVRFFYLVYQLFMLSSMRFELEFQDLLGMCQQELCTYFFKGRQIVFFFGARHLTFEMLHCEIKLSFIPLFGNQGGCIIA